MTYRLGVFLALSVIAPGVRAGELSNLYDQAELVREQPRLSSRVRAIFEVFRQDLAPEERRALADLQLAFPLVDRQDPFAVFSRGRTVTLSVHSLKFLEDLCLAYAWMHVKGYSPETIDLYIAILRYRTAKDLGVRRAPPPLKALRIPANALDDPAVDGLSLRFRNSAFAFILAHELGHVYHRHPGYAPGVPRRQARGNEEEADRFALELMRRSRTIPMGAVLFFQATMYYFPNRGDFPNEQAWLAYLDTEATHPLNSHRLRALSERLDRAAADFGRGPGDKAAVQFIASGVLKIAEALDDAGLQRLMAAKASIADLSSLDLRRPKRPDAEP
jgi:hypothetical protein